MKTRFFKENIIGKQWKTDFKSILKLQKETISYLQDWFLKLDTYFWLDKELLRKLSKDINENSEILLNSIKVIDNTLRVVGEYGDDVASFVEDLRTLQVFENNEDYEKLLIFFSVLEPIIPRYYHFNHSKYAHFSGVPTLDGTSFSTAIKPVYDYNLVPNEKDDGKQPQKIINFIPVALLKFSTSADNKEINFQIDIKNLDSLLKELEQIKSNLIDLEQVILKLKTEHK
jgi:hypothetical protein